MDEELVDLNVRYVKQPEPAIPEDISAHELLRMVYRGRD
jgi:hypothetical protein